MRTRRRLVALAALSCAFAATAATALAGSVTWGSAVEVPGAVALNTGGWAWVQSVSCADAGDCAAGGTYSDRRSRIHGFVVSEQGGTWGQAIQVPGTATHVGPAGTTGVQIMSVSCAGAGECVAVGSFDDPHGQQAFLVEEKSGVWSSAVVVPRLAALNTGGEAEAESVSCSSPGNCVAGGYFKHRISKRSIATRAFVVAEKQGTWGKAITVPGTVRRNLGRYAGVTSVSCVSPGNCAVGGYYLVHARHGYEQQAFLAAEKDGKWGKAITVPGTAILNRGNEAQVTSVSCPGVGDCVAVGYFSIRYPKRRVFAVAEKNGKWGEAIKLPGTVYEPFFAIADAEPSISCGSPGNCAVGGYHTHSAKSTQAFVATEVDGTWGAAMEVPGTAALNAGNAAAVFSVSCASASAGNCAAGGVYTDEFGFSDAFVVAETDGTWGTATEVPGAAALGAGGSAVFSVSCVAAGSCALGGAYNTDPFLPFPPDGIQALVTSP